MNATPTQLVLGAAAYWVGRRVVIGNIERILSLGEAVNYGAMKINERFVENVNNGELRAAFNALKRVGVPEDIQGYSNDQNLHHLIDDCHNAIRILRCQSTSSP